MEASYDRRRYDQFPSRPPPNPPTFYPRISQTGGGGPPLNRAPPPVPGPAPTSGIGIRVALKPEFRVAPQVQLSPLPGEVPRTTVQFDFDFEHKVIADAERGVRTQLSSSHSQLANGGETAATSLGARDDPVMSKYLSLGLSREAVALAIASYGDVQNKVVDFCSAYSLLREMGFPSDAVVGALVMYDNDKEKALAHFV